MGEALTLGYDLSGLAGCYVAIGLVAILLTLLEGLDRVLNVGVLGVHPFAGLARAIQNTLVAGLKAAESYLEGKAAQFESGLVDAFALLIATPVLLAEGVYKAMQYGWNQATKPLINALNAHVAALSAKLTAQVGSLETRVTGLLNKAEDYADAKIASAATALTRYADAVAHTAQVNAERYAADAVEALRGAETAAIAKAASLAAEARSAGEAAAAHVLERAEREIAGAESAAEATARRLAAEAEATAAGALASAQAAGQSALSVVAGVADAAETGVLDLQDLIRSGGWAALIASVPALALLLNAIATESGLENAACRAKVKGICGTDPRAWEALLAGLAVVGFGFSLREIVEAATGVVSESEHLLEALAA